MPLNRIRVEEVAMPQTENVGPLLARLKFSPMFEAAMKHVLTQN